MPELPEENNDRAKRITDALFIRADSAYFDNKGTHVMFLQCYDEYDKRGPQPTNLGVLSRKQIENIIMANL